MNDLKVYFNHDVNSESREIKVFKNDNLIAHGHLNLCSNMAHIRTVKKYEDMSYDIEKAIEQRNIWDNRILIN
tara:strand:- start:49 stop:267 length:219 start_codon:yes stop_codon:yes gene_type:complete